MFDDDDDNLYAAGLVVGLFDDNVLRDEYGGLEGNEPDDAIPKEDEPEDDQAGSESGDEDDDDPVVGGNDFSRNEDTHEETRDEEFDGAPFSLFHPILFHLILS